jgi:hypothetical protein
LYELTLRYFPLTNFCRDSNRGINANADLPENLLAEIYESIRRKQLKVIGEDNIKKVDFPLSFPLAPCEPEDVIFRCRNIARKELSTADVTLIITQLWNSVDKAFLNLIEGMDEEIAPVSRLLDIVNEFSDTLSILSKLPTLSSSSKYLHFTTDLYEFYSKTILLDSLFLHGCNVDKESLLSHQCSHHLVVTDWTEPSSRKDSFCPESQGEANQKCDTLNEIPPGQQIGSHVQRTLKDRESAESIMSETHLCNLLESLVSSLYSFFLSSLQKCQDQPAVAVGDGVIAIQHSPSPRPLSHLSSSPFFGSPNPISLPSHSIDEYSVVHLVRSRHASEILVALISVTRQHCGGLLSCTAWAYVFRVIFWLFQVSFFYDVFLSLSLPLKNQLFLSPYFFLSSRTGFFLNRLTWQIVKIFMAFLF